MLAFMDDAVPEIMVTVAIPHDSGEALTAALPRGVTLDEGGLRMPNGRRFEVGVRPQDHQFWEVVSGGTDHPPSKAEARAMREAPMLFELIAPGGSLEAAAAMLRAGAAICEAGGSGLLVHNSGIGHGAADWLKLAADADSGAAHWAFVMTTRSEDLSEMGVDGPGVFTMGMHCLGHRDVVMPTLGDDEFDWFSVNNFCGYVENSGRVPVDGDVLAAMAGPSLPPDQMPDDAPPNPEPPPEGLLPPAPADGSSQMVPMHRVRYAPCTRFPPDSPMHNPYGLYVLDPLDPDDPESHEFRPSR